MRLIFIVLFLAIALRGYEWISTSHNTPWAPLSLTDPIGPFTLRKIDALADDYRLCQSLLENAGRKFSTLPPVRQNADCGYDNGVALENGEGMNYSPAAKISCPVAAGLVLWEWQILRPAAFKYFSAQVDEIITYGGYSCRRINNAKEGNYSEHASANAIDIAAFRLSDGHIISVASHWNSANEKAAFLKEVRDGACEVFATTLSPDYNAAHADHLHLDQARRGGRSFCR
ncbi:extensin family protein [Parasphingorhabdus sp.]|uniref:extensin-like domain-containing protein n=1 Tax=Parasphingorhabdus sp. TaxID=2709688 RepID=UPI002F920762